MPAIFVHLSDIHFGQGRDERVHIHGDVKKELILDAADVIRNLPGGIAHGILVSGDIAFSGRQGPIHRRCGIPRGPSGGRTGWAGLPPGLAAFVHLSDQFSIRNVWIDGKHVHGDASASDR